MMYPKALHPSLFLMGVLIGGCHPALPSIAAPTPLGAIHFEMVPNNQLQLPAPSLRIVDNSLLINGNVYRKPGETSLISGRLHIQIIKPDNQILADLTTLITPDPLPTEGRGESGYHLRYGLIPPVGSTIRIQFIPRGSNPAAVKTN